MGALELSGTTAFSSRTKHICTRYHFLRELVASNKIIISHVKTTDQLADIFTKFLDYPKFKAILEQDNQRRFLSYSTRSSTFASSLVCDNDNNDTIDTSDNDNNDDIDTGDIDHNDMFRDCLLYTSPSPRD